MQTSFASKVIMFEEVLEFKQDIFLCYEQQKTIVLQQKVPKVKVWASAKTFTFILNKVVYDELIMRVWLLSDAFNTCIN